VEKLIQEGGWRPLDKTAISHQVQEAIGDLKENIPSRRFRPTSTKPRKASWGNPKPIPTQNPKRPGPDSRPASAPAAGLLLPNFR